MHRKLIAMAVISSLLTSCANVQMTKDSSYEGVSQKDAAKLSSAVMSQQEPVVVHSGQWIVGDVIETNKNRLPSFMNQDVMFRQTGRFTLYDLVSFISTHVKIKPMIDQSVFYPLGNTGSPVAGAGVPGSPAGGAAPPSPAGMMGLPGMPAGTIAGQNMGMPGAPGATGSMANNIPSAEDLSYQGTLSGFLDYATAQLGVFWEYSNDGIVIFKTKTAVFNIPSIPIQSSMQSSLSSSGSSSGGAAGGSPMGGSPMGGSPMGGASMPTGGAMGGSPMGGASGSPMGGSSGSTGSGGGTTTMATNINVDYWTKMERTVQSIAGYGATVIADSSFGTISVTGTPNQIERVRKWVDDIKSTLVEQVALDVKVYNVQITTEENYGFDPAKLLYAGSSQLGLSATPVSLPAVAGGSTPLSFGATVLSGIASGSNLVVQALSTMGKVSEVFSRSGVTINGQMLALQSANTQNYLASSGSSMAANVGSTTMLMPGQITTGFTGSFLPKVTDGHIFVDFNLTISDLVSLTTFTSGTGASASSIQLPQVVSTTLQQIASLKSGQSLVLTGYRDKSAHTINNGTITPTNYAFGGGVDSTGSDNVIVVVITARILN